MCKIIRRILCALSIGFILFMVLAFSSGGEHFRSCGENTGGILKKASETLAEKADGVKKQKDAIVNLIKGWTGKSEDPLEKTKEKEKASSKGSGDKSLKKKKAAKKEDTPVSGEDANKKSIGQRLDETVENLKNWKKN